MKYIVYFLGFSLVMLAACGKKPEAPPPAPVAVAPPPAAQNAPAAPVAPPAVTPEAPPQTAPSVGGIPAPVESINADDFGVMSKALLTFRRDKQRAPRDWQELISTGYLKKMPLAPAGKRYTFDPRSLDVHIVNQ